MSAVIDEIERLFRERGDAAYLGEAVSQTEHALQAAWAAEQAGAPPHLIAAALLHDVGHVLHNLPEDCADHGIDDCHEELGARFLARHFRPEVVEPVRLHVPAKRYLCATDPAYDAALSPASRLSLRLQGGPMTPAEADEFRRGPFADDAVKLRRFDELAKVPGLPTPAFGHFRGYVAAGLRGAG